jgi:thymidylate synthase (FAD)
MRDGMTVHGMPKTILVARPAIVWAGVEEILAEYVGPGGENADWQKGDAEPTDGDALPELMGRLCYGSFGAKQGRVGAAQYHANILAGGHGSVLEHANWSFVVARGNRALAAQMTRHRAGWAWSQESTHFIRYGSGPGTTHPVVCLPGIEGDALPIAVDACRSAVEEYNRLFDAIKSDFPEAKKKQVAGAAREVLPLALQARLGFTANARALRHFIEYRCNPDNVLSIRMVAAQVAFIMQAEAPAIFQDLRVEADSGDGWPTIGFVHRKV